MIRYNILLQYNNCLFVAYFFRHCIIIIVSMRRKSASRKWDFISNSVWKTRFAGSSFIDRFLRSVRGLRVGGVRKMAVRDCRVACARARPRHAVPNVSKRYETAERERFFSLFLGVRSSSSKARADHVHLRCYNVVYAADEMRIRRVRFVSRKKNVKWDEINLVRNYKCIWIILWCLENEFNKNVFT